MTTTSSAHDAIGAVAHAAFLPFVLFAEDLARIFRIGRAAARDRLARGDFGPRFRSGRRWAVLRPSLLAHLESRSVQPVASGPAQITQGKPRRPGGGK